MKVEQIYTGCLSQGTYYIECSGEVAIIDPLREVDQYIKKAAAANAKIKYVFETHFHADFVSGHLTLAEKTGAPIIYGPKAIPSYDCTIAKDRQVFTLGNVTIEVIHTPGHTLESTCYLLKDADGQPHSVFTGDTLFLGDVGRPDLSQKSDDMTTEDLAGMLYDSLRNKIMPLPDHIMVYPAHGAGSACGKNMMKITMDSLENQKKVNYALRADMTKEEFIAEVTDGLTAPPAYFPLNVKLNKEGYEHIDTVISQGTRPLDPKTFQEVAESQMALVLDVRSKTDFAKSHIPRSIFIGLDGGFAPWVGEMITDITTPILLVTDAGREEETVTRLSRVGFDNTLGYLDGGLSAWVESGREVDHITQIAATELAELSDAAIYDMRKPAEYANGHVETALNTPLSDINSHLTNYPDETDFYIHCQSGYRSLIAASILKSRGIHNFEEVIGGYKSLLDTPLEIVSTKTAYSAG